MQKFMKRLWEEEVDTHIILGNHDTYYKNTNQVNAITELCTTYDGVNEPWVYANPKEVTFDGLNILFMPWICDETYDESIHAIEHSNSEILMGHLEIKGFEMNRGFMNEQGLDRAVFKRFEKVISGHFHKKSDDGHIYYLGTQFEITWNDYKDPKGFHIFDTQTRELTRVSNPLRIFKKIVYDDTKTDYNKLNIERYDNTFIKMFISQKTDDDMYDKFVARLYDTLNIYELNIFEDSGDVTSSVREDILEQGEDTLTFLGKYIDQLDTNLDKQKLKDYTKELYTEVGENGS